MSRLAPPDTQTSAGRGDRDSGSVLRDAAPLLGLGLTLAVTVLAGLGAGHWLDGRLGTRPVFLLLGAVLGVAVALVYFFRTVAGYLKDQAGRQR